MKIRELARPLYETAPYNGSSKVLYHGTSAWNMALIIASDTLLEGAYWQKPNEPHGPRLTESFKSAQSFIQYASPEWEIGGVLVLNTAKLMQDYQLVTYEDKPYGSDKAWGEEQEVVPLTEAIKPLSKYLQGIKIDPEHIQEAMSDEGLEFAQEMWGYEPTEMRAALVNLTKKI